MISNQLIFRHLIRQFKCVAFLKHTIYYTIFELRKEKYYEKNCKVEISKMHCYFSYICSYNPFKHDASGENQAPKAIQKEGLG